jgi:hypothetical protein
MSKHVTESPEWTRFYWAVMAIAAWVILSSLFGCTPEPSACTEDYVATYWFLWIVPAVLFYWWCIRVKNVLLKGFLGLLSLIFFCLFAVPYMLMFALWVMTELIP